MYKYLGRVKNYSPATYYTYLLEYNGLQIELGRRQLLDLLNSGNVVF